MRSSHDPRATRRSGLEERLVLFTTVLVAVVAFLVVRASVARMEALAREEALARMRLTITIAQRAIERSYADLQASARLLAADRRLDVAGAQPDTTHLSVLLRRFATQRALAGCALVVEGAVVARAGRPLDWNVLRSAPLSPARPAFVPFARGDSVAVAAAAPLAGASNAAVVVAIDGGRALAAGSTDPPGLPVALLPRSRALRLGEPRSALRRHAVEWDEAQTGLVEGDDAYVAVSPVAAISPESGAIIETGVLRSEVTAPARRLARSLVALSVGVALVGAAISAALARRFVGPLSRLTHASVRIGRGDLATPIPRASAPGVDELSITMEEMRTRLLAASAELGRRQAEAETILSGIAEGVFVVDGERRIQYLNPQAGALLEVTPGEAKGRFCGDVLHEGVERSLRPCENKCPIVHARFRGAATATERFVTRSGGRRVVVITSAPPFSAAPEGKDWARQVQVIRDETGVEAARRMRDAILANVSHEFRTPLAAQLASIELLRDEVAKLGSGEVATLLFAIERSTLRLTQLIDNLLESVRIESGLDSIRRQSVALDEVVGEACDLAAPLLALREQELEIDLPREMPIVQGDRARLLQVFVNLLGNANKFAPDGSRIRIGGTTRDGAVTIWVEDEGPGIARGDAEAVFERFTRSTGEEPAESGMGLGLWIVKSIVERHGGSVAAAHEAGAGARISVTLPGQRVLAGETA